MQNPLSSQVLCLGLGFLRKEEHRVLGVDSEDGHNNDQRAGTPLSCEDRLRHLEFSGWRRVQRNLIAGFQYLKGAYKKAREGQHAVPL